MNTGEELILELSELYGIIPEYWDIFGNKREARIETRKGILKAMGLNVESPTAIMREIAAKKAKSWKGFVEPVQVMSVNEQPLIISLCLPVEQDHEQGLTISWYMVDEDEGGKLRKWDCMVRGTELSIDRMDWIDGVRYIRVLLTDPMRRDIGYYRFHAEVRHSENIFPGSSCTLEAKSRIVVTPDACYLPPELRHHKRWGLSINLYALRSKRNWGVGDFTDLRHILHWLADFRGSCAGINPLHAIPNSSPFGVSPYSPLTRLFRNPIYIDIERVPDVLESPPLRKYIASRKVQTQLNDLRARTCVDYEAVADLKEKVLRKAFSFFLRKHGSGKTRRGKDFHRYVREEGQELESFSVFMALRGHLWRTRQVISWREWPAEFRDAHGKAVSEFRKSHAREVAFHQYVQWLIDRQLRALSLASERLCLPIGLYFDLAVGSTGSGSDAWSHQDVMAEGAEVGAPPDDFSPSGQKWGFPPFIPERLRETGYELFIRIIRKNMKYGGAIRIDHALGLFRVFWIPDSMSATDGAYVEQPFQDLLRIIALESIRNKTLVIAEDLGTIGENVREALKKFRMLSYRLFYFERKYPDPAFLPPGRYPELAVCAVTTHDLPTLTGFWEGVDITLRKKLGGGTPDEWQKLFDDRQRDKKLILRALKAQGLLSAGIKAEMIEGMDMTPDLCLAIYCFLSRTPCRLMLVSVDDVIGTRDQQNLPGTVTEHPNWIRKTPLMLEEILKDQRLLDLTRTLRDRAW